MGQIPPLSGLQIPQFQRAHRDSLQSLDRESQPREHSADLAVASLAENQSEAGPASIATKYLQSFS